MSSAIEQNVSAILESARAAGTDAYTYLLQRAPDLAEQIVNLHIAKSALNASLLALFIAVGMTAAHRYSKKADWEADWNGPAFATFLLRLICGCLTVITVVFPLQALLKGIFAPDIVVIEYVTSIIRGF